MPNWLISLLLSLIERVVTSLWRKWQEKAASDREQKADEAKVDAALKAYKDAYLKAHDGTPVTKEQDEALRSAIRNLIRS